MYIKGEESRFLQTVFTVVSSLLVSIVGVEPKIMVRRFFPYSWHSLSTKMLTHLLYVLLQPRKILQSYIPSLFFVFNYSKQLLCALGLLSRRLPVSILLRSKRVGLFISS